MSYFELKNNANSTLASGINSVDVTLTVATGDGDKFPASGVFPVSIWGINYPDPSFDPNAEIVWCTGRTDDALTIVRNKEGTVGASHSVGANVALNITAGIFDDSTYGIDANITADIATHAALTATHGISGAIVGTTDSQILTNKTIDVDSNTVSNIENDNIKAAAGIVESKSTFAATGGHVHDGTASVTGGTKIAGSNVVNTPAGNVVATDVQAAITELDGQDTSHAALTTGVHGGGSYYIAKTSKSGQIGEFASTVVVGLSGNVDYLCDGIADNVQIQAAIDYVESLGGGRVIALQGLYDIATELIIDTQQVQLYGMGTKTKLSPATDINTLNISVANTRISNLSIGGTDRTKGSGIIIDSGTTTGLSNVVLDNLVINQLKTSGIVGNKWQDSTCNNVKVSNCGDATNPCIKLYGSSTNNGSNNLTFLGGEVSANYGVGVHLNGNNESNTNVRRVRFFGTQIHGVIGSPQPYPGIKIDGKSYDNVFNGCNVNGHGDDGFSIVDGIRNKISICTLQSNTRDVDITAGDGNVVSENSFKSNSTISVFDGGTYSKINNNSFSVTDGIHLGWNGSANGNTFEAMSGIGIKVIGAGFSTMNNNHFFTGSPCIDFNYTPDCISSGNTFKSGLTQYANIGSRCQTVNNIGFNPVGNFTSPTVPATTVNETNDYGYPCMVTIYGGVVEDIDLDDVSTGLTTGSFIVSPGGTINVTYSSVPTWKWWGL